MTKRRILATGAVATALAGSAITTVLAPPATAAPVAKAGIPGESGTPCSMHQGYKWWKRYPIKAKKKTVGYIHVYRNYHLICAITAPHKLTPQKLGIYLNDHHVKNRYKGWDARNFNAKNNKKWTGSAFTYWNKWLDIKGTVKYKGKTYAKTYRLVWTQ